MMMTATTTDYCECGHAPYAHEFMEGYCMIYKCDCKNFQLHSEQPCPVQASGETTGVPSNLSLTNDYEDVPTEHNDAPAAPDERAKCSHSDKSWRLSGNNPADVMCEYDYIAIGTTRKHVAQIVTEHNQHSTLIAQRERLLRLLRPVTSPTACYCAVMKGEKCWHCEARELIATIEQDQIVTRTTTGREG